AYPIFLLVIAIPALTFLLESTPGQNQGLSTIARQTILALLLAGSAAQAIYFHRVYRVEGPKRGWVFDAAYKDVYDAAVRVPSRRIYLSDVQQPAYEHAFWYATLEGRNKDEFIHLDEGARAPLGAMVIASEPVCTNCQVILKRGDYILYRSLGEF